MTKARAKFNEANPEYQDYWRATSEIIARTEEGQRSALSSLSAKQLVQRYNELDANLGVTRLLRNARTSTPAILGNPALFKNTNTILIYEFEKDASLLAKTYPSTKAALDDYSKFEAEYAGRADVVLVKAEDVDSLMRVFQNYFSNTADFIGYLDRGVAELTKAKF